MISQAQFLHQLSQLVAFCSLSSDQKVNAELLEYVKSLIDPRAHLQQITHNGVHILIASTHTTLTPQTGFLAHTDVVAGASELFQLGQKGDRLTGRGCSDMKFSIPLGVALLNELIESGSEHSFSLALTSDEEVGGFDGSLYLAQELGWRPNALIVPDGGDNCLFVEKAKGICQITVSSKGVAAHGSRPWLGKSALPSLCALVLELEKKFGKNSLTENWNTTLTIGKFHGGEATNQVCDSAYMSLDFRFPETDSIQKILEQVQQLAQSIDPQLFVELGLTGLPTCTDLNNPTVQKFLSCMQEAYGKPIESMATFGGSDARHFAQWDIPVLMLKPHGGEIHSDTEWLSLSSTFQFYQGLRTFCNLSS